MQLWKILDYSECKIMHFCCKLSNSEQWDLRFSQFHFWGLRVFLCMTLCKWNVSSYSWVKGSMNFLAIKYENTTFLQIIYNHSLIDTVSDSRRSDSSTLYSFLPCACISNLEWLWRSLYKSQLLKTNLNLSSINISRDKRWRQNIQTSIF